MPIALKLFLCLVAFGAALYLGMAISVVYVGLQLAAPAVAQIGPPPAIEGLKVVEIPSQSGSRLQGWFIPGRPGGGAVALMHGVGANRTVMVERAKLFNELGFAVLLFDFQAHGESPGQHITFGHLEAFDAAAAIDFLRHEAPGERVGAIGVSMGGAAALLGPKPLSVDALVIESVYPDIGSALITRLRAGLGPTLGPVFTPLLTPLFLTFMPPILGVSAADLRPIDRIGDVTVPLLVASGTIDILTPLDQAQALYNHARPPKRSWWVPGAGHVDLEDADPKDYRRIVIGFLMDELQRTPS